jgi:hypothetical protein
LLEIGAQENAAQFTGTENGQLLVRKFASHGGTIVTEEGRRVNKRFGKDAKTLQGEHSTRRRRA